jgi:hypothetical protein
MCGTAAQAYNTVSDRLGGEKLPQETFSRELHGV